MSIEVDWYDKEPPMLILRFGVWTVEEYMDTTEQINRMLDEAPGEQPVPVLVDVSEAVQPRNLMAHFPEVGRASVFAHPRLGKIIMVGAHGIIAHTSAIFSQVFHRLEMQDTLDEALDYIKDTPDE